MGRLLLMISAQMLGGWPLDPQVATRDLEKHPAMILTPARDVTAGVAGAAITPAPPLSTSFRSSDRSAASVALARPYRNHREIIPCAFSICILLHREFDRRIPGVYTAPII